MKAGAALFVAALAARVAFVFIFPERWADGFSHMMMGWDLAENGVDVGRMAGYKLPLYPLLCGLATWIGGDPAIAPRLMTTLFGSAMVPLTYAVARRLAPETAGFAAVVVFFAPHHLSFSAYAMSECVLGFFEIAALWALLRGGRWVAAAAAMLALAAFTRYEAWPLALGVWILAVVQKRATWPWLVAAAAILALPPAAWMAVNARATGDPLHFLHVASGYMEAQFYAVYPEQAERSVWSSLFYLVKFGFVTGLASLLALAGLRGLTRDGRAVAVVLGVHMLALFVLYWTRIQTGWARYWVPCIPMAAVLGGLGARALAGRVLSIRGFAALCVAGTFVSQIFELPHAYASAHVIDAAKHVPPGAVTYADEPAVPIAMGRRVLGASILSDDALASMRAAGVEVVVWSGVDYSPMRTRFPELRDGASTADFELIYAPPGNAAATERLNMQPVFVYRLKR